MLNQQHPHQHGHHCTDVQRADDFERVQQDKDGQRREDDRPEREPDGPRDDGDHHGNDVDEQRNKAAAQRRAAVHQVQHGLFGPFVAAVFQEDVLRQAALDVVSRTDDAGVGRRQKQYDADDRGTLVGVGRHRQVAEILHEDGEHAPHARPQRHAGGDAFHKFGRVVALADLLNVGDHQFSVWEDAQGSVAVQVQAVADDPHNEHDL